MLKFLQQWLHKQLWAASVCGLSCTVHAAACRLNVPASVQVTLCTRTAAHRQIAAAQRRHPPHLPLPPPFNTGDVCRPVVSDYAAS